MRGYKRRAAGRKTAWAVCGDGQRQGRVRHEVNIDADGEHSASFDGMGSLYGDLKTGLVSLFRSPQAGCAKGRRTSQEQRRAERVDGRIVAASLSVLRELVIDSDVGVLGASVDAEGDVDDETKWGL